MTDLDKTMGTNLSSNATYGLFLERVLHFSRKLMWEALSTNDINTLQMAADAVDAISNIGLRLHDPTRFSEEWLRNDLARFDANWFGKNPAIASIKNLNLRLVDVFDDLRPPASANVSSEECLDITRLRDPKSDDAKAVARQRYRDPRAAIPTPLRTLVDISAVPADLMDIANRARIDDRTQTTLNAGRAMLAANPALCARVLERVVMPHVVEHLLSRRRLLHPVHLGIRQLTEPRPSNLDFWAASILQDRKYGTQSPISSEAHVPDTQNEMRESYKTAIGIATACLAADWWESQEQCATGQESRRTSATFNICRLVCADLLEEADASIRPSFTDRLRHGNNQTRHDNRLIALLPRIKQRLEAFATDSTHAGHLLPALSNSERPPRPA